MPQISLVNGISFTPLDVPLHEARNAIYAVVHIETKRVYVGMTERTVAVRWRQHCYDIKRRAKQAHTGKSLTPEHRENLSAAGRGRIVSAETRAKIGQWHRGKNVSEQARDPDEREPCRPYRNRRNTREDE